MCEHLFLQLVDSDGHIIVAADGFCYDQIDKKGNSQQQLQESGKK